VVLLAKELKFHLPSHWNCYWWNSQFNFELCFVLLHVIFVICWDTDWK